MTIRSQQDLIRAGVAHLQAGRLDAARRIFRDLLASRPGHPDALHLMGLAAYQEGAPGEAVGWIGKAIAGQPGNPAYHSSLGLAMRALGRLADAAAALEKALALYPDFGDAHFNLGVVRSLQGRPRQAVAHFEAALGAAPDDPETHFNLGKGYQDLGDGEAAARHYRRVLTLRPDMVEAHYNLAALPRELVGFDDALSSLRAATAGAPDHAGAHAALAVVLEQGGRLEEARAAAERALALGPEEPDAHLAMASVEMRADDAAAARRRLEALLKKPLPESSAAGAQHALSQALDRLGDYAAAFAAQGAAHRHDGRNPAAALVDREALPRLVARLRGWFSAERAAAWPGRPPDDGLPAPAFLVGFPRSGTTLTEQILASHPSIRATGEEQLVFALVDALPRLLGRPASYPDCLDGLGSDDVGRLRAFYWERCRRAFGAAATQGRLLDKMPLNLIHLPLIRRIFPESQIVVALRDPRDVCLSCFMQRFTFNFAMIHFSRLEDTAGLYAAVMDLWLHYREALVPPPMDYRYEDLVGDFQGTVTGLLRYLGEDWDESVRDFAATARANPVATPSYRDVTRPISASAVGRWRRYREQLAPVLPTLGRFVEAFGYAD